ncbi:hypothetical protein [Chryseobacterium populi]|uniref:Uncharacterized protein n=1 Tax=Chryseobacterium populi TaxID=1144316 RepID=J3CES8_9FLAO|nr:hypothetical protein [Chryseobacterium populi]EJL69991.1 hypothetical protein PMI13_03000 [Chryseobacterium populi]
MDIKKSLLILILSFLIISCVKNNEVTLAIDDPFYANKVEHKISIDNNTANNYAFYSINDFGVGSFPLIGIYEVIIKDENNKKIESKNIFVNISGSGYSKKDSVTMETFRQKGFDRDMLWFEINRKMKKNAVFINPFSGKGAERKLALLASQTRATGGYYDLKKNKNYTIQFGVSFDSTEIRKYLTPFDIDSLKKNKIKIFHGKLMTKTIPLIVE